MKPDQLLTFAREQGLILRADGPFLRVRGPKKAVLDLRPKIQANKNELLALLREEVHGALFRTAVRPYVCSRCQGFFGEDELTWMPAASADSAGICQSCWSD